MVLEERVLFNGEHDGAVNGAQPVSAAPDGGDDGKPTARLPRWTRQEILVLIQGKTDAETRFRPGRSAVGSPSIGSPEPKWQLVSSYCKKHGVNREPVQCRKRWSNLAGDYKKIKEWESRARDETESFWVMRNDMRRERKLPGYFDKEVYDILDAAVSPALAVIPASSATAAKVAEEVEGGDDAEVHIYDSNRRVSVGGGGEDGLFSDSERDEVFVSGNKNVPHPVIPISAEKQYQPPLQGEGNAQDATNEKQPASNPDSTSQGERKRKRFSVDSEEETLQSQLIDVLEKNGRMLRDQLEAQNVNFQLDRQQQKDTASNIVAVLDKLADALGRIADKL
ncbi:trihelix transcription factor ASR3 [Arachis ipaensis]|uniref:trihelix transcription factor ASR3 n=1 Tax=Arachis ipaensis TaxID=130454 RepID=UPI0007AF1D88|nr:trihelix transcription factor ASR3 [Arachis ipaensis]XP_025650278.1 trihelix transcription factor ASR3-like [Arachis hypogaea]XP_025697004.1 trihelix transcription factor ASR3-like [Arachis hypogaea]QHO09590.1 Trihelix transcription factor [Arachis hypogaea]